MEPFSVTFLADEDPYRVKATGASNQNALKRLNTPSIGPDNKATQHEVSVHEGHRRPAAPAASPAGSSIQAQKSQLRISFKIETFIFRNP